MHRYARNAHDAHVPTACRASQHIIDHDYAADHANLVRRNADIVNQSEMLQQLSRLQKACAEPVAACFIGSRLAGIIIHTHKGIVWADYDSVTCTMLSPRIIRGTSIIEIRNEIHRGGLVPLPGDASVTIRKVG